jgi:hypothetical protein
MRKGVEVIPEENYRVRNEDMFEPNAKKKADKAAANNQKTPSTAPSSKGSMSSDD